MSTAWRPPPPVVADATVLHEFRRNAAHLRQALAQQPGDTGPPRLGTPSLGSEHLTAYQRQAGPVRRALRPSDRIALERALLALRHHGGLMPDALRALEQARHGLEQELDSTVSLGGAAVTRRQLLADWLDATTFHNGREFKDSYGRFLDRWGQAAEAIAIELLAEVARLVLRIDDAMASALDEPLELPPPPPFVSAAERPWWKRILFKA